MKYFARTAAVRRPLQWLWPLAASLLGLSACMGALTSSSDEASSQPAVSTEVAVPSGQASQPRSAQASQPPAAPRSGYAPAPALSAAPAGRPATSHPQWLDGAGYVEHEFFVRGLAERYEPEGEWRSDGVWPLRLASLANPYATRVLVRRPADPARFNGVVVVEWLNTALKFNLDGAWALAHEEFVREGYAWVGVSADTEGVEGLQAADPQRYAGLGIERFDLGYDVFTQMGRAVRQQSRVLLGGLQARQVLAAGYSQSAVQLTTYANAVQPVQKVFDGFMLIGRAPFGAPLTRAQMFRLDPSIRADLGVPVFMLQTETEVAVSWPLSKTPDTDAVRYWEVAGAVHVDETLLEAIRDVQRHDLEREPARCSSPVNALPLGPVHGAAWHALKQWVADRRPPPLAPRMARSTLGFVESDEQGHALGGLRLPELDAPLARYGVYLVNLPSGTLDFPSTFSCLAGGRTRPLPADVLAERYGRTEPAAHAAWLQRYRQALDGALAAGYLRPADHALALQRAAQRRVLLPAQP